MELWMVTTISSHWPLSPWRRILSHQHPLFVKLIRDSGLDPQTISRFGSFKSSVRFDQLILAHHSSGQAPPSQGQKVGVSSPRGEKGDRFFFLKNGKSCGHVSWIFLGGWVKSWPFLVNEEICLFGNASSNPYFWVYFSSVWGICLTALSYAKKTTPYPLPTGYRKRAGYCNHYTQANIIHYSLNHTRRAPPSYKVVITPANPI